MKTGAVRHRTDYGKALDGEIVALDEKGRSSFQLLQDIAREKALLLR